ncbi:MAG TPA: hypothetical protein VNN99_12170 [Vicinamibacterales bacterium]|nr:hypothetical protein [Vicinamibacterales bacterium]
MAALDSLVIAPASVEGQGRPTGTVTLSAPAPAGGAVVALETSNPEIAKVSASVTVPAGATTATFSVDTATVPSTGDVTIHATYLGESRAFVLTVRAPALAARFTVSSASRGSGACQISNAAGAVDCRLDATSSGGFVSRYIWLLGAQELSFPTDQAVSTPPTDCSHISGGNVDGGAMSWSVRLRVEDRDGKSSTSDPQSVNLYHQGFCGY